MNDNKLKRGISYTTDEHDYDEVYSYEQELINEQTLQDFNNRNKNDNNSNQVRSNWYFFL